jgi:hypothetical protein
MRRDTSSGTSLLARLLAIGGAAMAMGALIVALQRWSGRVAAEAQASSVALNVQPDGLIPAEGRIPPPAE